MKNRGMKNRNRFLHHTTIVNDLPQSAVVGNAVALFTMAIAGAEIVVGLALVIAIYRKRDTVYAEDIDLLKG